MCLAGCSLLGGGCASSYKILYTRGVKKIQFVGTALEDLRGFPDAVRRQCGYQLDRVQQGVEPTDWKSMVGVGSGVREIRVRDGSGAFRVIYVAKLVDRVVVLHCFQKKSQKTSAADLATARKRYQQVTADDGKGEW